MCICVFLRMHSPNVIEITILNKLFYFQMTTTTNQVTCSLCYIKIDELNWNDHLMSTKNLQNCKENKSRDYSKFFQYNFQDIS